MQGLGLQGASASVESLKSKAVLFLLLKFNDRADNRIPVSQRLTAFASLQLISAIYTNYMQWLEKHMLPAVRHAMRRMSCCTKSREMGEGNK